MEYLLNYVFHVLVVIEMFAEYLSDFIQMQLGFASWSPGKLVLLLVKFFWIFMETIISFVK